MLFGPQDFPDTAPRKRRARPNPCPRIPNTGWTARRDFPDLSAAKRICFDLETKDPDIEKFGPGWGRGVGHIVGAALGTEDGFKFYLPMRHEFPGSQNLDPHKVLDYLGVQLGRPHQEKVGHNMLYDLGWVAHEGVTVRGVLHDTWIAQKLLAFEDSASLEALSQRRLKTGKVSELLYQWAWQYWGEGLKQPSDDKLRKTAMGNLWRSPIELVGDYAESDVDLPIRLLPSMLKDLRAKGLMEVYRMECDLLEILVQMRLAGVTVDLDAAECAYAEIEASIHTLQKEIDRIAGRPVNTGSPLDMEKLFTKLLIPFNRTDNGKMQLTGEYFQSVTHPIGEKIIEIEELKKYNSTFIKGYVLESNVNGKVHAEFNQLKAVTGRMSSSSPNLQNVPSRNELAKVVRAIFIPDKGDVAIAKWDYSSVESRILAHYAVGVGSDELREEYRNNPDTDYHNFTQAMIKRLVGLELPRKHVKNVNFAGIYGASEKKLQSMMKLSDTEAESFFTAYHDGLPYVKETMEAISREVQERGYTKTIMGRRALFDKWEPRFTPKKDNGEPWSRPIAYSYEQALRTYGPNIKRAFLHKTLNYTIQGSAADLMKAAMVKCWKDGIYDRIGIPRLVVHDELDFSVREGADLRIFREIKHTMENVIQFRIPIKVEGEWGPNWSEQYKFTEWATT
jgi:DNA polymerase-1